MAPIKEQLHLLPILPKVLALEVVDAAALHLLVESPGEPSHHRIRPYVLRDVVDARQKFVHEVKIGPLQAEEIDPAGIVLVRSDEEWRVNGIHARSPAR